VGYEWPMSKAHPHHLALLAGLGVLLAVLAFAPGARAHIYWSDGSTNAIGRANLDGSAVKRNWITGANAPTGVAVDGAHVYWGNSGSNSMGRADLDGTGVDQQFITGLQVPGGVELDAGHIYWANQDFANVGRADLDGSDVLQPFIQGPNTLVDVAVNGTHVYWANPPDHQIGRADVDGSDVNWHFIDTSPARTAPFGVAVDGRHVYWSNLEGTIGRASLDGSGIDHNFITAAGRGAAIAVDAGHIYWAGGAGGSIGRANLDGTGVDNTFMTGLGNVEGLAVDALGPGGGPPGAGGPPQGGGQPTAGQDTAPPRLSTLRLGRKRFAAGRGTQVRFQLSEPAQLTFTIDRVLAGRRTRYRRLRGSFSHRAAAGPNAFTYRGRLRGRALPPGRYRLNARATDAAGNTSTLIHLRFQIIARR
jgi:virginiamycin B lyase